MSRPLCRKEQIIDAGDPSLDRSTYFSYDLLDRQISQTAPGPDDSGPLAAPVTTFSYDIGGNRISQLDPLARRTSWQYDLLGRRASEETPDPDGTGPLGASITYFGFDESGNQVSVIDPLGHETISIFVARFTSFVSGSVMLRASPRNTI